MQGARLQGSQSPPGRKLLGGQVTVLDARGQHSWAQLGRPRPAFGITHDTLNTLELFDEHFCSQGFLWGNNQPSM